MAKKLGTIQCTFDKFSNRDEMVLKLNPNSRYPARNIADKMLELQQKDKEIEVVVQVKTKKRSNNANALCWTLCEQIGVNQKMSSEEVYRSNIVLINNYITCSIPVGEVEDFKTMWGDRGIGWVAEVADFDPNNFENKIIFAHKGSSTYDTEQMARLIDGLVQDAKALGIDVMSEQQRTLLLEDWNNGN